MNPSRIAATTEVDWYDQQIPDFTGPALDSLYGSLYSSLPQLALGDLGNVSTYVDHTASGLQALFLYTRSGKVARVMNEGMPLAAADVGRFATRLFQRFDDLVRIDFHAVACDEPKTLPHTCCFTLDEDIVIDLPATEADYLASLGRSTRKTLRQNLTRAQRLTHRLLAGSEVDHALIAQIIAFNHARLAAKQRRSALDDIAAHKLRALVQHSGLVSAVYVDGRLVAGTLACRISNDMYSLVNAHDPHYDHLGMGNLSRHLLIVAAIHAGARRFHLMGGNFSSKRSCGAERRPLQHLVIYRSRWQRLIDLPHSCQLMLREQRYWLGVLLDDRSAELNGAAWLKPVAALARGLRAASRAMRGSRPALR